MKNLFTQKTLFLIIVVLFWFAQYVYIPFQNPYLAACGVSSQMIGLIVGTYGIAQCIMRLPAGIFADLISKSKVFILAGVLSAGTASVIRIISPDKLGFLVGNIFSGIASSMWISYMVYFASFYKKDESSKATGTIIAFNNIGMLLGFVVSTIFYDKFGMRFICLLSAVSGALGAVLSMFVKEHRNNIVCLISVKDCINACKNKNLIFFSILALVQQGIQMSTTMSFTNQILKSLNADSIIIGMSSIIYMISAVLSAAFASSKLCARKGPVFWIPFVFVLVSVYCILVPLAGIKLIFVLQILPGMSTGVLLSLITSESMKEADVCTKSTAMGMFQAVYAIGMFIFPIIAGEIANAYSMKTAYFVLAIVSLSASSLSLIYYKKDSVCSIMN